MKLPYIKLLIITVAFFTWTQCRAQGKEIARWAMFPEPEKYMNKYNNDTPSKDIFMDRMESLINLSVFYPLEEWLDRKEDISYVTITILKDGNPVSIVFNQPVVFSRTGNIKPAERLFMMFEGGEKYMFDYDKLRKYNGQVLSKYLTKAFATKKYEKYTRYRIGKVYVQITVYADGKVEYSLWKKTPYEDLNKAILEILYAYPGKITPARYPDGETFTQGAFIPINFTY